MQQQQPQQQQPLQQTKVFTTNTHAQAIGTTTTMTTTTPPQTGHASLPLPLLPAAAYAAHTPSYPPLYPAHGIYMHPSGLQQQQLMQQQQQQHQWMQQQQHMLYAQQQQAQAAAAAAAYSRMGFAGYGPAFLSPQPLSSPQLSLHTQLPAPPAPPAVTAPPSPSSSHAQQQLHQQQQQQQLQAQSSTRLSARCPLCQNIFAYGSELATSAGAVGADVLCPHCRQAVRLPPAGITTTTQPVTPILPQTTTATGATLPAAVAPQQLSVPQSTLSQQPAAASSASVSMPVLAADHESAYYAMLAPYADDFDDPHSALVWLSRATPSRTWKFAVPRTHRSPKSSAGQGGYTAAFQTLGLVLRESDTNTGHWHSWYAEPRRVSLKALQAALLRRWREAPSFQESFLLTEPGAQMDDSDTVTNTTTANAAQAVESGAARADEITPASQSRSISADEHAALALLPSSASLAAPPPASTGPVLPEAPAAPAVGSTSDDGAAAADVTNALSAIFQANASSTSPTFPERAWALKDSTLLACIRAARLYNSELAASRGVRMLANSTTLASPISALTHHTLESPVPLPPAPAATPTPVDSTMNDPMVVSPTQQQPSHKRKDAPDEATSEIPPVNAAVVAPTGSPILADGLVTPPVLPSSDPSRQPSISSAPSSSPNLLGFGSDFIPSSLSSGVSPISNGATLESSLVVPCVLPDSPLVSSALVAPMSVGLNHEKPPTAPPVSQHKQPHKKRALSGADDSPEPAPCTETTAADPSRSTLKVADRSASRSSSSSGSFLSPSPSLLPSIDVLSVRAAASVYPLPPIHSIHSPLDVRLRGGDSASASAKVANDSPDGAHTKRAASEHQAAKAAQHSAK